MGCCEQSRDSGADRNLLNQQSRKTTVKTWCVKFVKPNALVLAMVAGVLAGITIGMALNSVDTKLTRLQLEYLRFPGDIFIQLMRMLVIPIVVTSLLCSTAEIDVRSSGKIGLMAMVYYLGTMLLASFVAITLAEIIRPGERASGREGSLAPDLSTSPGVAFMDLIRNMIPDNLIESCFASKKTKVLLKNISLVNNSEWTTGIYEQYIDNTSRTESVLRTKHVGGVNVIGLVVVSIVFGLVTADTGAEARPFLEFFKAVRCVTFRLVAIFLWFSPVGICFLIASRLTGMEDPGQAIGDLAMFVVCVLSAFAIHGLVVLPLLYLAVVRRNPLSFYGGMLPALLFAFGSASSSAVLPLTIKCLEEKNGVDPRVTKLIASVGATINMDGACVYFNVMAIFVAQLHDIPLSASQLFIICILSVSVSVGASGIPAPGSTFTVIMLSAVGLPLDDIGALLAADWILERFETALNVLGDAFGAGMVGHLSRHDLRRRKHVPSHSESTSHEQIAQN